MFIFKRPLFGVLAGLATALLFVYFASSYGSTPATAGDPTVAVTGAGSLAASTGTAAHPVESTLQPSG